MNQKQRGWSITFTVLPTSFITVIEVNNLKDDVMIERCVIRLIIVSKEKHTFSLPKRKLKQLLPDPSEPKVRCHINYTHRDVKEL